MVDVRGDVLRPPHGTTPAAVKSNIKSEMRLLERSLKHHPQKRRLRSTLVNYKDVFALHDDDMGYTNIVKHEIKTNGSKPVKE